MPEATGATDGVLKAALDDEGYTEASHVDVLADGADGLESVVRDAVGRPAQRRLDWFHISLRLRPIEQMLGRVTPLLPDAHQRRLFEREMPRLRWQVWHGRGRDAIRRAGRWSRVIRTLGRTVSDAHRPRLQRFRRHLVGLRRYLRANVHLLFNNGETRRGGRRISTATAESSMNHLVNARMGKRRSMRWSADGAHLLLQVRCALLDDRLDELFRARYPAWGTAPPARAFAETAPPGS